MSLRLSSAAGDHVQKSGSDDQQEPQDQQQQLASEGCSVLSTEMVCKMRKRAKLP